MITLNKGEKLFILLTFIIIYGKITQVKATTQADVAQSGRATES